MRSVTGYGSPLTTLKLVEEHDIPKEDYPNL
jgi:hypothetical protein